MEEYKIYYKKTKLLKGLLPWLGLLACGIAAVVIGIIDDAVWLIVVGAVVAPVAFFLVSPMLGPLFTKKPFLSFNKSGVTVNQGSKSVGFLPWKAIDRMGTVRDRGFDNIGFAIKDYKQYKKNLTHFQIALIEQNRQRKLPHICVSFAYSKNELSSVYPVIKEFFTTYR